MRCYSLHEKAEYSYFGNFSKKIKPKFGTINKVQIISKESELYHIKFDDGTFSKISSHWITLLPSLLLEKSNI